MLRHDLIRYGAVSVLALAVDLGTLSLCLRLLHLSLAWSVTIGFSLGALVAYLLSIRWVFSHRAFGHAPAMELMSFVGIGVVGLGLTQMVLWIGVTQARLMPELVKLGAAAISFAFNYLIRKTLLFAVPGRTAPAQEDVA
ncbi:MAG: GtrA family protein [Pseudomonadota bacterium]|nr:GtrA family protein [Pseudomonadota bacterium]